MKPQHIRSSIDAAQSAAAAVMQAAQTLSGATLEDNHRRDDLALNVMERAVGWRYLRGAEGLHDLLESEGERKTAGDVLAQCTQFVGAFATQLQTARGAGKISKAARRLLTIEAVRALAHEMLDIAGVLEFTGQRGRVGTIEDFARKALRELDRMEHSDKPRRRARRP